MEDKHCNGLFEQLLPLVPEPDFEEHFERIMTDQNGYTRYLVKMELSRLRTPCRRCIDLRKQMTQNCFPYEYQGIRHYMDDIGIAIFESQLKYYGHIYTIGVYEHVLDMDYRRHYLKLIDTQPHSSLTNASLFRYFDVTPINFASYHGRHEERIHYSSQLMIRFQHEKRLYAKTSDISISGLKIQVHAIPDYQINEIVDVYFTEFSNTHSNTMLRTGIKFKIIGELTKGEKHWLRLIKIDGNPEFDDFIQHFIDQNRCKYRVSVDDSFAAAMIKGYEQFYISRLSGIPLFFDTQPIPKPNYLLRTENNLKTIEYWRNEKNRSTLEGFFHAQRMKSIIEQPSPLKQTLIYSFTHTVKNRLYFYCATHDELNTLGMKALFFKTGAGRPSWRVYRLYLEQLDTEEIHRLSESIVELHHAQGNPRNLSAKLSNLGWVGFLQDITHDIKKQDFLASENTEQDTNHLRQFGLKPSRSEFDIKIFNYVQSRKEERFIHKTLVEIHLNGKTYHGWTRDLSTQGLQIECDEFLHCDIDDIIHLTFTNLNKKTKSISLEKLPYSVVGHNHSKTILHLNIKGILKKHNGFIFLSNLIASNKNKLDRAPKPNDDNIDLTLRNIYTQHLFTYPIFFKKDHLGLQLSSIGVTPFERSLSRLLGFCSYQEPYNLYPFLHGPILQEQLFLPLKKYQVDSCAKIIDLFIACQNTHGKTQPSFITQLESDFDSFEAKREFVCHALQQGEFYSVRILLSSTDRPDLDFIASDLNYVTQFAEHKAKQLADLLWSIKGIAELIDTTAATRYRLDI